MEPKGNSNVMQSSVPVNLEPRVETVMPEKPVVEKMEKKPSKMNGMIIGMVTLVFCLVVGLSYYVLKDNGVDLLALGKQTDTTTEEDTDDTTTTEEDNTDTTVCEKTETTTKDCTVVLDNAGWELYSIPEYDFSVEIPTYSLRITDGSEKIPFRWETWFDTSPMYDSSHEWLYLLDNKVGTFSAEFLPKFSPNYTSDMSTHLIYVNIYENTDKKSLESIITSYRSAWEEEYVDSDIKSTALKGNIISKYNTNVWNFEFLITWGTWNGYLVSNDKYIYEVKYHLGSTPTESYQIALKVIDSMKFGE